MQNAYLQMMEETQRLIGRASEISSRAEAVTDMLKVHKKEIADIEVMVIHRFEAIRAILTDDEENYKGRFALLQKELDEAIGALEGKQPEEPGPVEPPIEPPPVEAKDPEVSHV